LAPPHIVNHPLDLFGQFRDLSFTLRAQIVRLLLPDQRKLFVTQRAHLCGVLR